MIDIPVIIFTAIILFILGLVSTYLWGFDLVGIVIKVIYISIVSVFYLYMCYFDESELVEGLYKWGYFGINVLLPIIIGELIGDFLASIVKGRNLYE